MTEDNEKLKLRLLAMIVNSLIATSHKGEKAFANGQMLFIKLLLNLDRPTGETNND
jgi:hypothetical protein